MADPTREALAAARAAILDAVPEFGDAGVPFELAARKRDLCAKAVEAIDAALAAAVPAEVPPSNWQPTDEQVADAIESEFSDTHEWPEGDGETVRAFLRHAPDIWAQYKGRDAQNGAALAPAAPVPTEPVAWTSAGMLKAFTEKREGWAGRADYLYAKIERSSVYDTPLYAAAPVSAAPTALPTNILFAFVRLALVSPSEALLHQLDRLITFYEGNDERFALTLKRLKREATDEGRHVFGKGHERSRLVFSGTGTEAAVSAAPVVQGVAERQAFEAWCKDEGVDTTLWMDHAPEAGYANGRTLDYWTGWNARAALAAAPVSAAPVVQGVDLSQWETARYGVFLPDGRFEELPADDPVGLKHPLGHTARWVGGTHDAQLLRAALAAAVPATAPAPPQPPEGAPLPPAPGPDRSRP